MATIKYIDEVANDSDKSIVVPSDEKWKILYAMIELVTTATVSNRQMALEIKDELGNHMFHSFAGAEQPPSDTKEYIFTPGAVTEATFRVNHMYVTLPPEMIVLPGWTVRFYDANAIDPTADDLSIYMTYQKHDSNRVDENSI